MRSSGICCSGTHFGTQACSGAKQPVFACSGALFEPFCGAPEHFGGHFGCSGALSTGTRQNLLATLAARLCWGSGSLCICCGAFLVGIGQPIGAKFAAKGPPSTYALLPPRWRCGGLAGWGHYVATPCKPQWGGGLVGPNCGLESWCHALVLFFLENYHLVTGTFSRPISCPGNPRVT